MPTKLKDTLEKVRKLDNKSNSDLLIEFYEYLRAARTSERYQSDILKVLVKFSDFINDNFMNVQKKEQVIAFLNTKIKKQCNFIRQLTGRDYPKYYFIYYYIINEYNEISI